MSLYYKKGTVRTYYVFTHDENPSGTKVKGADYLEAIQDFMKKRYPQCQPPETADGIRFYDKQTRRTLFIFRSGGTRFEFTCSACRLDADIL